VAELAYQVFFRVRLSSVLWPTSSLFHFADLIPRLRPCLKFRADGAKASKPSEEQEVKQEEGEEQLVQQATAQLEGVSIGNDKTGAEEYAEGERCEGGYGKEVDEKQAARCYQRGAEKRYAPAAAALGRCYMRGIGVEEDEKTGQQWCNKAVKELGLKQLAETGDLGAQRMLGYMCHYGEGVAESPICGKETRSP
jgi:TPR repeat protein